MTPRQLRFTAAILSNCINTVRKTSVAMRDIRTTTTFVTDNAYPDPGVQVTTHVANPNMLKGFNIGLAGKSRLLSLLPPGHELVTLSPEEILTPVKDPKPNAAKLLKAFTVPEKRDQDPGLVYVPGQLTSLAVEASFIADDKSNMLSRLYPRKLEFRSSYDFDYKLAVTISYKAGFRLPSHRPRIVLTFYTIEDTILYLNIVAAEYLNGAEGNILNSRHNEFILVQDDYTEHTRLCMYHESQTGNALNLLLLNLENVAIKDFDIRGRHYRRPDQGNTTPFKIGAVLNDEFESPEVLVSIPLLNLTSYSNITDLIDSPPTTDNTNKVARIARVLEDSAIVGARDTITETLRKEIRYYFLHRIPSGISEISTFLEKMEQDIPKNKEWEIEQMGKLATPIRDKSLVARWAHEIKTNMVSYVNRITWNH